MNLLHIASLCGIIELVELFTRTGTDPNSLDDRLCKPLHHAISTFKKDKLYGISYGCQVFTRYWNRL